MTICYLSYEQYFDIWFIDVIYDERIDKMEINTITELQIQLIINNNLFKRNIIDENTFTKANEKLLRMIKTLQTA